MVLLFQLCKVTFQREIKQFLLHYITYLTAAVTSHFVNTGDTDLACPILLILDTHVGEAIIIHAIKLQLHIIPLFVN